MRREGGKAVSLLRAACMALIVTALPAFAGAQSLLERPPNMGGAWVAPSGVIQFNFMHRFNASPSPQRKVTNVPTFLLAAGLPARTMLGVRYATSSQVAPDYPNEWEFFGRVLPVSQQNGGPVDLALHAGYNNAATSVDGEVTVSRSFGRLRLLGAARGMSNAYHTDESRFAVAGGALIQLTSSIALAGDVATLLDAEDEEDVAWSAGVHFQLPYTPHTISLHASNVNSTTIQGATVGSGDTRYGFEFTIPFTLSRYFGRRSASGQGAGPAVQASGDTVRVIMQNLAYQTPNLEIRPGTTVIWENRDAVPHTVTSNDGAFDSGLIEAGRSWSRTFTQTGTFAYHCTPHPFMTATVTVR